MKRNTKIKLFVALAVAFASAFCVLGCVFTLVPRGQNSASDSDSSGDVAQY